MLSEDEFAAFVHTRGPALLRTACFLAGNRHDGEDLLQQSLVAAYASFRRIREPQALEAYVRTTMTRASIAARRRAWRRHEVSTERPPEVDGRDEHGAVVDRGAIWPLLQQLSPQQRAVMVLRYYEGLSEAEIADQLGCSAGTVKSHASRALDRLRDLVDAPHHVPEMPEPERRRR